MNERLHSHTIKQTPAHDEAPSSFKELETLLSHWKHDPHALIEILHTAQQHYGWLDKPLLGWLANQLGLPPSLVYGVASFYHAFHMTPRALRTCTVCTGTSCHLHGSSKLLHELEHHLGIYSGSTTPDNGIALQQVRCLGACSMSPLLRIEQVNGTDHYYGQMTFNQSVKLLQEDVAEPKNTKAHTVPATILGDHNNLRVLESCIRMDQDCLADTPPIVNYPALARAVLEMSPEQTCRLITDSGLRGRGGGGYPTGTKWELVRQAKGRCKFVVANGDEGDPGAFMDRTLMEYDPHRVLEGMAIAGYAVGARNGFIYVRDEYPLAARRLRQAIMQAETAGLLGCNLFGTHFSFKVSVRIGAGAFVCGEETALMASIMGRRGQPVIRPPYPPKKGLWGCPTLINNVETFGNISTIICKGAELFRTKGTDGSTGTKLFSISGDVARTGVVEVPLGTTMRELLALAGGVTGGNFKAAQTGGASGGCIPAEHLDLPIDYESLKDIGTIMGSGGLVVFNDKRCMVDLALFFMEFCGDESCGKCTPCRTGTQQAVYLLRAIVNGQGSEDDLRQLEELCRLMHETSLCGLGMAAPSPVLSTLRWYRDEYLTHIRECRCPSGSCNRGPGS